jgi:hypothetical protein
MRPRRDATPAATSLPPSLKVGAELPPVATSVIALIAALKLAIHLLTNSAYGIFRDEFYFIVCGRRLAFGYVDHPPFVPLLARLGTALFGETIFGVRFFAAVMGSVSVVLAALLARELGGGRFAQGASGFAVLCSIIYLGVHSTLGTHTSEVVFWTASSLVLARLIRTQNPRLWPLFGLFAGLGLQNKHSIVFYGFGLVLGLLFTPERRLLWSRWLFAGGLVAFVIFLPNLLWQASLDWPTLEFLTNVKNSSKNVVLSPFEYFGQQILLASPILLPLWISGIAWPFLAEGAKQYRVFGWSYLITFVVIVALKGKNYYLGPIYATLFAAGAVAFERWTESRRRWSRPVFGVLAALMAAIAAPVALPILSPERLLAYQNAIGFTPPRSETSHTAALPQTFADQLGWEDYVERVARVYRSLPEEERAKAGIFTQNYGEAGAIDVHGKRFGLPPALSGHQNYYLWGPQGFTGEVLLVIDESPDDLRPLCESVEDAGPALRHPLAMPYENRTSIYICRRLKQPLDLLWPKTKVWL